MSVLSRIVSGVNNAGMKAVQGIGFVTDKASAAVTYIPRTAGNAIIAKGSRAWKNRKKRKK